jgi:small conductance mechanosensitive channel
MGRARIDATLSRFAAKASRWAILVLAVLGCLGLFGINVTTFAALIGAAGLAIGLAFQGTLGNLAAGVMLLVFRPFKVDDAVNVAGELGKVYEIGLFTTCLDTFDNRRIIIPNGQVFGSIIENISHHDVRRADVPVGVDYGAGIDETREVLTRAALSVPGRLTDREPQVVLSGLGASSVDWEVRVWAAAADFLAVKQATIRAVKTELDGAGIGIPFPQMDVHLDQAPAA